MFDTENLSPAFTAGMITQINAVTEELRARKLASLSTQNKFGRDVAAAWARMYLQAHARRYLSLIDGGLAEWKSGRTVITALCSRTILEDAAALYTFINRLNKLLDEGNDDHIRRFVFGRALATKKPYGIETEGLDVTATNVTTFIAAITKLHPGYKAIYDALSEVTHPNSAGVLFHFTTLGDDLATFHDGENISEPALDHFLAATFMFSCVAPDLFRLEARLEDIKVE